MRPPYFNEPYDKGETDHPLELDHVACSDFLMNLAQGERSPQAQEGPLNDSSDISIEEEQIIRVLRILNLLCIEYFSYAFASSIVKKQQKIFFNSWLQRVRQAVFPHNNLQ